MGAAIDGPRMLFGEAEDAVGVGIDAPLQGGST